MSNDIFLSSIGSFKYIDIMSNNITQDISDSASPPSYTNPNAPTLDMDGNLYNLNSVTTTALTVNGASLSATQIGYLSGLTPGIATASKALVVDASRNIGNINSLAITGTTNSALQITNTSSTGLTNIKLFNDIRSYEVGIRGSSQSGPANGYYIWDSTGGYRFVITATGNVGIGGYTSPSKILSVNGDINYSTELYKNDVLVFTSALTGVSDVSGAIANKALILDSGKSITGITSLTSTSLVATNINSTNYNLSGTSIFMSALTGVSDVSGAIANKVLILDSSKSIAGITSISTTSLAIIGTTASTSSTTGALTVAGGLGIKGAIFGGGNTISFSATTKSESLINYTPTSTVFNNGFSTSDTTARYTYYFGAPTYTANATTTTTNATTLAISGAPIAGTNQTITNSYAFVVEGGRTKIGGSGTYTTTTNTESILQIPNTTYTASGVGASDIARYSNIIGQQTFTSGSSTTIPNAYSLYISGAPVAGTNVSITNAYAFNVGSGSSLFQGQITTTNSLVIAPNTVPSNNSSYLIQAVDSAQATTTSRMITLGKAYSSKDSCAINYNWTGTASTSNYMSIGLYGLSSYDNSIVISGNGNIGIGTTSPSYGLDITGTMRATGAATFGASISATTTATIGTTLTVNGSGPHTISGTLNATLASGAQTGITSVGTLSTLSVSGTVSIGASNITTTIAGYLASATTTNTNASSVIMCDSNKDISGINKINATYHITTGTQISYLSTDPSSAESSIYAKLNTLNNTSAAGTDANHRALTYIRAPVLNSTNAITTTNASTMRIEGPPTTSGSAAITNRYALYANGPIYTSGVSTYVSSSFQRVHQWSTDNNSPVNVELYINGGNRATPTFSAQLGTTTTNEFALMTNNIRRFYITSAGDTYTVGPMYAGTFLNTPYIQVGTSTDTTRMISCNDSAMATSTSRYITLGSDNSTRNQAEIAFYYAGLGSSSNQLRLGYHGGSVVYVQFNNKVGIANSAPTRELDVTGAIAASTGYFMGATQIIDNSRNASFANISGTITTAAQGQITSLGTLTGLTISSALSNSLIVNNTNSTSLSNISLRNDTSQTCDLGINGTTATTAANCIVLMNNANYRMVIDTAGKVGFSGTTSPVCVMDLGTVGTLGTNQLLSIWSNGSSLYGWGALNGLLIHQGYTGHTFHTGSTRGSVGTEIARFTASGLGINTTTITRMLEVNGSFNCTSFYLNGSQITSTATQLNYPAITTPGTAEASKSLVLDSSKNISGIANLTATGNIGAATLDASSYIQVGTSTDTTRMISCLDSTLTATNSRFITIGSANTAKNQAEISFYYAGLDLATNQLRLGGHSNQVMYIQFDKKVGIDVQSPAYTLDVNGDINIVGTAAYRSGTTIVIDASRNGIFNNITGTLLTAAQPNITSTGNLTQLKVSSEEYILDTYGLTFTSSLSTLTKRARISGDGSTPSLIFDANVTGGYMQFLTKKGTTLKCFEVNDSTQANNALTIYADNKIGINQPSSTASLSYTLDVNGTINTSAGIYVSGVGIYVSGINTINANRYAAFTSVKADSSTITIDSNVAAILKSSISDHILNNTSAAGTDSIHRYSSYIGQMILTATNAITTTNASSVYIAGSPIAGTNQTLTNVYSLYINGGNTYFGSTTEASSTTAGAMMIAGGVAVAKKLYVGGDTFIGNRLSFAGTTGDIGSDMTVIAERIYGGTEQSEMILFKGNDPATTSGPDRIRMRASVFTFQTYTATETYTTLADNNDRLTIINNGNVGIANTAPAYTLDVSGNINYTGTLYSGGVAAINSSGLLQVAGQTNITSVGTLTSLKVSGNLRVGSTATADFPIHVGSGAADRLLALFNTSTTTDYYGFGANGGYLLYQAVSGHKWYVSSLGNALGTQVIDTNSTRTAILQTTEASSTSTGALVVSGGAGFTGNVYTGGNVVIASGKVLTIGSTSFDEAGFGNVSALSGVTPGTVAASKAMIVDSSKNISGLNVLTLNNNNQRPLYLIKSDLGNGGGISMVLSRSSNTDQQGEITFNYSTTGGRSFLALGHYGVPNVLSILSNQRVGINQTNPSVPLEISASVNISTGTNFSALTVGSTVYNQSAQSADVSLKCSHAIYADKFVAISDRRKKTFIENIPVDESMKFIEEINPVKYCLKKYVQFGGREYGYIAQDLKNYPCMISMAKDETLMIEQEDDLEGICLGVNYEKVIPILHSVLKQTIKEKNEMAETIASLQEQLASILARLDNLEK